MPHSYVKYLPEVFKEKAATESAATTEQLLQIVQAVFGELEDEIQNIPSYFSPSEAVQEFLPWLASWTSLILRTGWSVEEKRKVLQKIIPLYKKRGTKCGLDEYLFIYVKGKNDEKTVTIENDPQSPYAFIVTIKFADVPDFQSKQRDVHAVLHIEKPAHTQYRVKLDGPTFRVGVPDRARVGVNSLI